MALPPPVAALFDRQLSVAANQQLRRYLTHDQVMGLRRRGIIEPAAWGVQRLRGGGSAPGQDAMIAWLRAGRGARVTGPAVLGMRNVDGFEPSDPFEVLIPRGRVLTNVDFPWRWDPLPQRPRATWNGMSVVSLDRALPDSARSIFAVERRRLLVAYDSARWRGLLQTWVLRSTCEELGPRDPGAAYFLEVDLDRRLDAESSGERTIVDIARMADLVLILQVWLAPDLRPDAVVRGLPMVLEFLGSVDHDGPEGRAADARRFQRFRDLGYHPVGIRAAEFRQPAQLAARLRREADRVRELIASAS